MIQPKLRQWWEDFLPVMIVGQSVCVVRTAAYSHCHIETAELFQYLSRSSEVTGVALNWEVGPGQRSQSVNTHTQIEWDK